MSRSVKSTTTVVPALVGQYPALPAAAGSRADTLKPAAAEVALWPMTVVRPPASGEMAPAEDPAPVAPRVRTVAVATASTRDTVSAAP